MHAHHELTVINHIFGNLCLVLLVTPIAGYSQTGCIKKSLKQTLYDKVKPAKRSQRATQSKETKNS